ncbi:PA domain-containing protein [Plasmodiophora brassicae]
MPPSFIIVALCTFAIAHADFVLVNSSDTKQVVLNSVTAYHFACGNASFRVMAPTFIVPEADQVNYVLSEGARDHVIIVDYRIRISARLWAQSCVSAGCLGIVFTHGTIAQDGATAHQYLAYTSAFKQVPIVMVPYRVPETTYDRVRSNPDALIVMASGDANPAAGVLASPSNAAFYLGILFFLSALVTILISSVLIVCFCFDEQLRFRRPPRYPIMVLLTSMISAILEVIYTANAIICDLQCIEARPELYLYSASAPFQVLGTACLSFQLNDMLNENAEKRAKWFRLLALSTRALVVLLCVGDIIQQIVSACIETNVTSTQYLVLFYLVMFLYTNFDFTLNGKKLSQKLMTMSETVIGKAENKKRMHFASVVVRAGRAGMVQVVLVLLFGVASAAVDNYTIFMSTFFVACVSTYVKIGFEMAAFRPRPSFVHKWLKTALGVVFGSSTRDASIGPLPNMQSTKSADRRSTMTQR